MNAKDREVLYNKIRNIRAMLNIDHELALIMDLIKTMEGGYREGDTDIVYQSGFCVLSGDTMSNLGITQETKLNFIKNKTTGRMEVWTTAELDKFWEETNNNHI